MYACNHYLSKIQPKKENDFIFVIDRQDNEKMGHDRYIRSLQIKLFCIKTFTVFVYFIIRQNGAIIFF